MKHRLSILICLFIATTVLAAAPPWVQRSKTGMVASDSRAASQIGANVLARGGNAFDAAVATSFALAVAHPHSTGLGGGGFMIAYLAHEERFIALDFRETAPAAATANRYARLHNERSDGPSPTIYGGHAVGVPGQLAGLAHIHDHYCTRPWRTLLQPAIELCRSGFVVDEHYRAACQSVIADFEKWPQLKSQHTRIYRTLLRNGEAPAVGDRVVRPNLVRALRSLAGNGSNTFYRGPIAAAIVRAVTHADGKLTRADLQNYEVRQREPLRGRFMDYEVISMPPPSSGGVCILETLNVLTAWTEALETSLPRLQQRGDFPIYFVNALQHGFADRARWLGDADFTPIPVQKLTDLNYARQLVHQRGLTGESFGTKQIPDDQGTSHFCIADRHGNLIALTETINGSFGSLVVAEPFGIILNNQMDDFAANPGKPNLYGLIQGEANAVAPGKRPLSSMSPTIVFRNEEPVLMLGASGGPRIITSVLQVLLHTLVFDMSLEEALQAVRIHHQWRPDLVYFDQDPPAELTTKLKNAGHQLADEHRTGVVQAIRFLPDGTMVGGSDPRKGGRPAGVETPTRARPTQSP